jgi:hypothetical protein
MRFLPDLIGQIFYNSSGLWGLPLSILKDTSDLLLAGGAVDAIEPLGEA